jgi:phosphohistidine phosphatase SixA
MVWSPRQRQPRRATPIRSSSAFARFAVWALLTGLIIGLPTPASGADIWTQLRGESGLVVLLRHAIAPGGGDPPGFRLGDCATQRNLSAEGRAQARAIGEQFIRRQIPVAGVQTSRWCRARETARLLGLGAVRERSALDSVFTAPPATAATRQRQAERIIRAHRGKPGALILVGHQANIVDLTGIAPASGEGIVVRADRRGKVRVVGRIPAP